MGAIGFIQPNLALRIISGVVISALSFFAVYTGGLLFFLYVLFFGCVALYEWLQLSFDTKRPALYAFIGIVYIAVSFGACMLTRFHFPVQYILVFFFAVAFSDMGAYAFGKVIGGPKLAKSISPKKTWAGFFGALFMPALICALFAGYAFSFYHIGMVALFFGLGAVLGALGQVGDLFASSLKRQAGAKDSGTLIPGHGGVLDRMDAMMLAIPVYFLFMLGFSHGLFF